MRKLLVVNDRKDCERGVQLPDGRVIVVSERGENKPFIYLRFDEPINIEKEEIYDKYEMFEEDFRDKTVTLNALIANGLGKEVFCYDEWDIYEDEIGDVNCIDLEEVAEKLAAKGVTVSVEGLAHNLRAWWSDMKSGYRDEKNGVHIFTPCGCNPLSFRVTTLEEGLDWQDTYEW